MGLLHFVGDLFSNLKELLQHSFGILGFLERMAIAILQSAKP